MIVNYLMAKFKLSFSYFGAVNLGFLGSFPLSVSGVEQVFS